MSVRKRWSVVVAVVLVVVARGGGVLVVAEPRRRPSCSGRSRSRPAGAAAADVDRLGGAYAATLGADVDAGSSAPSELAGFLDDAFEADLSPMSALVESRRGDAGGVRLLPGDARVGAVQPSPRTARPC